MCYCHEHIQKIVWYEPAGIFCHDKDRLSLGEMNLKRDYPDVPVMCCSATADLAMIEALCASLKLQSPLGFRGDMQRFNLGIHTELLIRPRTGSKSLIRSNLHRVCQLLEPHKQSPFLVYVRTPAEAQNWAEQLQNEGFLVGAYHGQGSGKQGVDAARDQENRQVRDKIQQAWEQGSLHGVVATSAFGMGAYAPVV